MDKQERFLFWDNICDRLVDSTATQRLAIFCMIGKNTYRHYEWANTYTFEGLGMCFSFGGKGSLGSQKIWQELAYSTDPILWERVVELDPSLAGVE
jgi:hypothetical protein